MTAAYEPSPDPSGATTYISYDGHGNEDVFQAYNIVGGQAPIDVDPTDLPSGDFSVGLKIANLQTTGATTGYVTDPNTGQIAYEFALQYGQGTASVIETSAATGATNTVAIVHNVATMVINGQWEPIQGFIGIAAIGFYLDTGPKVLTDQSGGTNAGKNLELSGNVVHYVESERFNFADGEVVNIADNGVQVASATIHSENIPGSQTYLGSNDTAWDASLDLTPGDNQITITTTDANGLTGSASLDYTYTAPGSTRRGGGNAGGGAATSGTTGGSSASRTSSGSVLEDTVSIDPAVTFLGHGAFALTGQASSTTGVKQVELFAQVDGDTTDLGAATVAPDGSFTFTDQVGAHAQGFITATLTDGAGQTATAAAAFDLQGGITGAPYVAEQNVYDSTTGAIASTSLFRKNGSRVVDVEEPGQTLTSGWFDTFVNGSQPDTTFVFDPGHGLDTVQGFRAGGADHDTISLAASDFTSIADILSQTQQVHGGVVIHDPTSGDTVRLAGIGKVALVNNRRDFTLHA